jgi:hypothetical protein
MTIKQLQEEARKRFEFKWGADKIWVVPSKNDIETIEEIKSFQDTLIEQTYKQAQQTLIKQDIERLEGRKIKEEKGFINMIFGRTKTKIPAHSDIDVGYNKSLQEEINFKKEQL